MCKCPLTPPHPASTEQAKEGQATNSKCRSGPWIGHLGQGRGCIHFFLSMIKFNFKFSDLNHIPKGLWEMLTVQPHFKCSYPGGPGESPSALYRFREGPECLLRKRALGSSSCKLQVTAHLQMKPALLLRMWKALHRREATGLWGSLAQGPTEKFRVGWWPSELQMHTHRGGSPQLLRVWNDSEWLFQYSLGWTYGRALRPTVPGCLLWWCPFFFSQLCNKPLSLSQHFPDLFGHRTVFIFIIQWEPVSYKCKLNHINVHVSFILIGKLLHNNNNCIMDSIFFIHNTSWKEKKSTGSPFLC